MPYVAYTLWFIGFSAFVPAVMLLIQTYSGLDPVNPFTGFLPPIVAALLAGMRFAGRQGREPSTGETWRFGLVSTLIVMALSGSLLAALYALGVEEVDVLVAGYETQTLQTKPGVVLPLIGLAVLLFNRTFFKVGGRRGRDRQPAGDDVLDPSDMQAYRRQGRYIVEQPAPQMEPGPNMAAAPRTPFLYYALLGAALTVLGPLLHGMLARQAGIELSALAVFAGLLAVAALVTGVRFARLNGRAPAGREILRFALIGAALVAVASTILFPLVSVLHPGVAWPTVATDALAALRGDLTTFVLSALALGGIGAVMNGLLFPIGAALGPRGTHAAGQGA